MENLGNYTFKWKLEADLLEIRVRWSIFTIISVCAGLPALVWSVSDLIHHRKNGHRISVFIILLLFTDLVELFLSPCILIKDFIGLFTQYKDWTFRVLWPSWWSLRACGLLLNQLVALEEILSVKDPLLTASVFSSPCFRIFYIHAFLLIIIDYFSLPQVYYGFIAVLVLTVSVIIWIISCGASSSAHPHSHSSRKPDRHILVIFILTLLVFYLPFIAFNFSFNFTLSLPNIHLWLIPIFLMNVRLISDPLLCVLVCRQNLRIQTSQNPEVTSLV